MEEKPQIEIVTLWGAKGLTSDFVYVLGLADEALPGGVDPESGLTKSEHEDEQRRLLYVSLTRAKVALVLSRPTIIRHGPAQSLGLARSRKFNRYWRYLDQCRFLAPLSDKVLPAEVPAATWPGIDLSYKSAP